MQSRELSRGVKGPTIESLAKLKHLLRYLAGTKDYVLRVKPTCYRIGPHRLTLSAMLIAIGLDVARLENRRAEAPLRYWAVM